MPRNHVVDERLETLRDALRQAAIHSSSARTRWAAQACLDAPSPLAIVRVAQSLSCSYAPGLRRLTADYWRDSR
jgi:hypothetical protein